MNKKLLVVAIAAALAPVAAMADSGNVQIYGSVHMSVDSLNGNSAQVATDNNRETNISSNSSFIGFKGSEDLGNGLKAIWQMETQVGMGNTAVSANTDNGNNSLTSRNSFLGLTGGFGTAILGKHDTPVKILGRKADLFGDQIGDSRNLIAAGGAGWDLRPSNVVAYISPTFSGFHGAVAYVSNVTGDAVAGQPDGAAMWNSVTAVSALGIYESGPVMVGLGYEKHNLDNLNGTVTPASAALNSAGGIVVTPASTLAGVNNEKIWRMVGGYTFGDFKVVGLFQKASDLGGGTNDRKTWGLGGAYKMGATTIKAQYYKASDLTDCGTTDCGATGANMIAVGADYSLSKRTVAYVAYARTNNDAGAVAGTGATFSAFGGGHGDNPGTVAGKDPSGFSLGMKHSF